MATEIDMAALGELARKAGAAIMEVFNSGEFDVEAKDDSSPLTRADTASHAVIAAGLERLSPEIPVISEEGRDVLLEERQAWARFWCVDPLDGTKEFIRREQDFTVNIALVENGLPTLGVVYAPARDWLYTGRRGEGAWKTAGGRTLPLPLSDAAHDGVVAVRSKSHPQPEEATVLDALGVTDTTSMGSSLKFCLVAEGAADVYYRAGPTWEWDTAAAHAVVAASGGEVLFDGAELRYNKPTLKNDNGFLCVRDAALAARVPVTSRETTE